MSFLEASSASYRDLRLYIDTNTHHRSGNHQGAVLITAAVKPSIAFIRPTALPANQKSELDPPTNKDGWFGGTGIFGFFFGGGGSGKVFFWWGGIGPPRFFVKKKNDFVFCLEKLFMEPCNIGVFETLRFVSKVPFCVRKLNVVLKWQS